MYVHTYNNTVCKDHKCVIIFLHTYVAPVPRIFLRPKQGVFGEAQDIVCTVAISSTVNPSIVKLMWNFNSTDSRVTITPMNVTTDDSIGNIYTTVIQFAYLMEEDKRNYTCSLTIVDTVESNFTLEILSKHIM